MYILRNVTMNDLDDLFDLSGKVSFINLPHDEEIIKQKITASLQSFKKPSKDLEKNYYIFVIEDTKSQKVIGVSMIHAQHGTEKEPHFFLRVSHENKYSQTINTGFVHGTLKLGLDTNGPTEIGGLVIHPEFRGKKGKLGKQISFVRFLYMAIYPERFKETIHSELMPPFDENGRAPLWEAIGRRFMNMGYQEADILSRSNKEFILSLFPSDNIYMTLLPMDARNAVGKVGNDTLPVKKMLENIGFQYIQEIDPFDGGPHYQCKLQNILPIKNKLIGKIVLNHDFDSNDAFNVLMSIENNRYDFLAVMASVNTRKDKNGNTEVIVDPNIIKELGIKESFQTTMILL